MALLEVRDLHKTFGHGKSLVPAVRGVDLDRGGVDLVDRAEPVGNPSGDH